MARLKNTFTPPDWNANKNGAHPVEVASDSYTPKSWVSYWVDVAFSNNLYYLWAPMTVLGILIGSHVEFSGNYQYLPLFCFGIFFGLTMLGFLEKKLESAAENRGLENEGGSTEERHSDSNDLPYDDYHYHPGFSHNPSNFYHKDD